MNTFSIPVDKLDKAWLRHVAALDEHELLSELNTRRNGLSSEEARRAIEQYGVNEVYASKQKPLLVRFILSFADPFVAILVLCALVSFATDVVFAQGMSKDPTTPIIIGIMVLISGVLRFVQELKSNDAAEALVETIETTCNIERLDVGRKELPLDEVALGDIVHLSAGDMVPADVRIISARDLFIGQSALTGEAEAVEKYASPINSDDLAITELSCLAFMGTTVISGAGVAVVVSTGESSLLGSITRGASHSDKRSTSYNEGINHVSSLLLRLMLIMAPLVFIINGITKADWLQSLLFAFSVAVGLTPEMLPMIVTTCLAKGAVDLSGEKVVVKRLDAIQDLGAMDVLCTDKTGTLTEDSIALERHLDALGNEDVRVLAYAFLNSFFETGLRNLIDSAIISRAQEESNSNSELIDIDKLIQDNYLIDELPFDFERRRVSVVVGDASGSTRMITKGAIEEILSLCTQLEYKGEIKELDDDLGDEIIDRAIALAEEGFRVLGVAVKANPRTVEKLDTSDENDMVFVGYLAFLDPPKPSAGKAIAALSEHGVETKVLTGDSTRVARYVCASIGLSVKGELEGWQMEGMDQAKLEELVETTTLFSKLSPDQKVRVIDALKSKGHTVGFMGDGVNDAPAMNSSDCGISVDTAVDIAKEAADIILLEKDLNVLEHGVELGRKTFMNMSKYIRITASSNFGNIFSVLAASAFLPFLPMTAVQLLLVNLINDIVCTSLPWDTVEEELLMRPRTWDSKGLSSFMRWIGPVSSVFDIVSYLVLFFVICPFACGGTWASVVGTEMEQTFIATFQAGWFVESMLTQILAIHILRTDDQLSDWHLAGLPLIALSIVGASLSLVLVFTPLGSFFDFATPPLVWLVWLVAIMVGYGLCTRFVRKLYARRYSMAP